MTDTNQRIRVSQSLLRDWNKCQHYFGLVHVQNLTRRYPTRPLQTGTLIHAGMEGFLLAQFANPKITRDKGRAAILDAVAIKQGDFLRQDYIAPFIDNEWKDEANKLCIEASEIAFRCAEWLGFFGKDCEWETVAFQKKPLVEFEMLETESMVIDGQRVEYDIGGKLDWVARNRKLKKNFLIDFKSRDQMQQPEYDHPQTQSPVYLWLLRKRGIEVHGTGTLQIRRAIPVAPKQNQTKPKGEKLFPMSRAAIVTDWPTYEKALLDAGLDPKHYEDMRLRLKPFFSISPEIRGDREVNTIMDAVHHAAEEILSTPREKYYRERYPMNCRGCDMEEICTADLLGHDVDFIRESAYMDKTKPRFVEYDFTDDEADPNDEDFAWGAEAADEARRLMSRRGSNK